VRLLVRRSRALGIRTLRGVASLALLLGLTRPGLGQAPETPASDALLNLVFSNGRVVTHPIGRGGEVWVPQVPPLTGPVPSREGQTLSGLGVTFQTEGQVVVATVFLTYGLPIAARVKVATRTVTAVPAVIDELRTHGVQPVTLSLVPLVGGSMQTPAGSSVSKALTVTVKPLAPGGSRYSVTVANASSRTAEAIRLDGYRGSAVVISALQRGQRGEPVVGPGSSATFVILGGGSDRGDSGSPAPLDRIAITTVVWEDGFEGDSGMADEIRQLRLGQRRGLERVLPVLRQSVGRSVQELQSRLSELSAQNDPGTRLVVNTLRAELTKAVGPLPLDSWLASTIPAYEQWLARVSGPAR